MTTLSNPPAELTEPHPNHPHYGHIHAGGHRLSVHVRAVDHLPVRTAADRFNKWLAVKITGGVGTMWCAYVFACISLSSLPSTLALHSVNADVQWVAQTFLQLVLLSVIIVGQNIQATASDARAAKTFDDTERVLGHTQTMFDWLDLETAGGLASVLAEVKSLRAEVAALRKA